MVQEWIVPLLPLSVTCLAGLFRRTLRAEFWAFVIGFLPYLYLCVRQLVFEPECGAYMMPLLPAAALLTAQVIPARRAIFALSLLVAVSVFAAGVIRASVVGADLEARYEQFESELRQAAGDGHRAPAAGRVHFGSHAGNVAARAIRSRCLGQFGDRAVDVA